MSLSNNQPDPVFPPLPPAAWPPVGSYTPAGPFGDLSVLPIENQPITMALKTHFQTLPIGTDPFTEDPSAMAAVPADVTLSESASGVTLS